MKKKSYFYFNFTVYKSILIFIFIIKSLSECPKTLPIFKGECSSIYCNEEQFKSGECQIRNSIMKTQWLNNIIKFENTNGDIYLYVENIHYTTLIFATTLSNNEGRIIYGLDYNKGFIFQNETDNISYIKTSIPESENKDFEDGEISIISNSNNYIIFVGNGNKNMEILNSKYYSDGYYIEPISDSLNETNIMKGVSSFSYNNKNVQFFYSTLKLNENNSSNYILSLNLYQCNKEGNKLKLPIISSYDFEGPKGKYVSCFPSLPINFAYVQCCYINTLNEDNNYFLYTITIFLIDTIEIKKNRTFTIGEQTKYEEDTLYFIKGFSMNNTFCIYSYFSGEHNDIPSFEFKKFNPVFVESNIYDNIPVVYLNDYVFNNDIRLNDIIKLSTKTFLFVSTKNDKETLIIAYFTLYYSKKNNNNNVAIRYFLIDFKTYYNMEIFHGLKIGMLQSTILSLAIDYCLSDECNGAEEKSNAALILFSYLDYREKRIDFIENAFINNKNYISINVTENTVLKNNIFGLYLDYVNRQEMDFLSGINYTLPNAGLLLEEDEIYRIYPENDELINIDFSNYNYEIINIEIILVFHYRFPDNASAFNNYIDSFNNNYGDIFEDSSYSSNGAIAPTIHYYIDINYELSTKCNDSLCSLCLRNDTNYCIICKDLFKIIDDKNYFNGKQKICLNNTDEFTNIDITINLFEQPEIETSIIENTFYTDLTSNINNEKTEEINMSSNVNAMLSSVIETISIEKLLKGNYESYILSNEEIKDLYEEFKNYLKNKYDGKDIFANTSNVKIQISRIDSKYNSSELSNIDFGKCGEILKSKYYKNGNDSLIMLKFDIMPENEKSTYVLYDIYEINSETFLKLEECSGEKIMINIPINLDSNIEFLYDILNKSGYNLFDGNDSFYNDICTTFRNPNGTDILIYDRRMDLYSLTINISLCQKGCLFIFYDLETKKAKCDCPVENKKTNIDLSEIEFDKNEMKEIFKETIKNSNFKVMKCYRLLFIFNIFKTNVGSILMTIFVFIYILLLIISLIIASKKINLYIKKILNIISSNCENIIGFNVVGKINKKIFSSSREILKDSDHSKAGRDSNIYAEKSKKNKRKKKRKISESKNQIENLENKINNTSISKNNIKGELINSPTKRRLKNNSKKNSESSLHNSNIFNEDKNNEHKQLSINKNNLNHNIIDNNDNIFNHNYNENHEEKNHNGKFGINQINLNVNIYNHEFSKGIENKNNLEKTSESNLEIFSKTNYGHKNKFRTKKKSHQKNSKLKKSSNKNVNFSVKKMKLKNKSTYNSKRFIVANSEKRISGMESKSKNEEILSLNDEEMNTLIYEKAIELDKRTYFQYFISLVKKKQLILFTFLPANDYNITANKMLLFIISLSLYSTINGFFFNDDTMHRIYKDNGNYNIIYQIPLILYSSVIPSLINLILKTLALSEKSILTLKQEKEIPRIIMKSKKVKKCIYIKFSLFFILSLILMLFFWYFISCFCAVYKNTQSIFFKDTLISLCLSMLYPFGISLLTGILRLPALRSKNKDKKLLYAFSQFIAML